MTFTKSNIHSNHCAQLFHFPVQIWPLARFVTELFCCYIARATLTTIGPSEKGRNYFLSPPPPDSSWLRHVAEWRTAWPPSPSRPPSNHCNWSWLILIGWKRLINVLMRSVSARRFLGWLISAESSNKRRDWLATSCQLSLTAAILGGVQEGGAMGCWEASVCKLWVNVF